MDLGPFGVHDHDEHGETFNIAILNWGCVLLDGGAINKVFVSPISLERKKQSTDNHMDQCAAARSVVLSFIQPLRGTMLTTRFFLLR